MDATNMATFAAEKSLKSGNARFAKNRDMVNPILARTDAPNSWRQV